MKRLLTILFFLSVIFVYGQDSKPSGRISLQSPNNVTWDYNPLDQTIGMSKGTYKWNKFFSAKKVQFLIDSLDIIKQNKLTITNIGVSGPALLSGNTLNIPQYSGSVADSLKEDKANKENTTISNDTIKYPTVNLLKTYADTKAPLFTGTMGFIPKFTGTNTIGNSVIFGSGFKIGVNNTSLEYDFQVGSGEKNGYNTVGIDASVGIPSIYFGKLGSYLGYDYAGNERMIFNSRYINSHYEFRINDVEKMRLESGGLTLPDLASTNPELLSHSSDGSITKITNGTGFIKNNGSGTISYVNDSQQSLSGTNVTWNLENGKDAIITLTGNTVITLTNATQGLSGTLWVTNPSTVYTLTFAGYVNFIDPYIRLGSNMVITSGSSKFDDYTFKYNGSKMNWNGTLDRH